MSVRAVAGQSRKRGKSVPKPKPNEPGNEKQDGKKLIEGKVTEIEFFEKLDPKAFANP